MSGCETVRETLVDVARGAPIEDSLREHLESCPDCRRRLTNERMLSAGLAAMSSGAVPPASVRNAVMAEFRRANRVTPIRRPVLRWVAMAAAAVILLAVFVATRHRPAAPGPEKTAASVVPAVPAPLEAPAPVHAAPAVTAKAAKPARRRRAVKVQPPPADPAPEVATDFFAIPYSEPLRPEERVDVFRIEMPRADMAVFGLPVAGGRLDARVTADVLTGEDGVVRAVRFIR
jgi:hypothetical protein